MKDVSREKRKTGRPLSFDKDVALKKAMLTFWEHGYETTSISDLTAAMDVTAPSIYAAYGDKKHLFLEAAQLYVGPLDDVKNALFNASSAYAAAHGMLIASAKAFTGTTTPRGCLLASATASGSKDSDDVKAFIADIRRKIDQYLCARIQHDVDLGILPQTTDCSALSALVIALIQGMSVLARDGADRNLLLNMIEAAMGAWPESRMPSTKISKTGKKKLAIRNQ